jgi:hypothetical protein
LTWREILKERREISLTMVRPNLKNSEDRLKSTNKSSETTITRTGNLTKRRLKDSAMSSSESKLQLNSDPKKATN